MQVFNVENEKVELPVIEGKKDVFISYKHENSAFVTRLFEELGRYVISM